MLAGYEIDGDLASLDYVFEGAPNVRFDYGYDRSGYLTAQEVDNTDWRWSPAISTVGYQSASYATNRLDQYTAVSGQAVSYDANGNLTADGLRAFTYTAQNQLLTATTLTGGTAHYSYGPAARRVRKEVDGVGTDFLHAGEMEIAEYDSVSGGLLRRYIPGAGVDQRVAIVECGASSACIPGGSGVVTRHYVADRQGHVMAVANADGTLNQQFFYTPFGVELVGEESGNPFRYTGRRYDPETGLYYYRARYYDADLGRFLQVDPVGYEDQWNLYAYVGNNPLNATDPSGMIREGRDCNTRGAASCYAYYPNGDPDSRTARGTAGRGTGGGPKQAVPVPVPLPLPPVVHPNSEETQRRTEATIAAVRSLVRDRSNDRSIWYHGTSRLSAERLADGARLRPQAAAEEWMGPRERGFYLTQDYAAAESFAIRRAELVGNTSGGGIVQYSISNSALSSLIESGSRFQTFSIGNYYQGEELFIPVESFAIFSELMAAGEISSTLATIITK